MRTKINYSLPFIIIPLIFFYLWDIGNIDAMRQGTESLYLQISKEMFEKVSILTPIVNNATHWSKPPLHFWLPMPIYLITGEASLWAARLSIAIVSLLGIFLIGRWIKNYFNIPIIVSMVFFASSLGFIKYSRIFMMEIPLAIFSVMASLFFFDYLKTDKLKYLIYSSLSLGLATLVKGPVSLVMCAGGAGLFLLFRSINFKSAKKFSGWLILSTIIGSIWFLISYLRFGNEFFEYFFIRENIGKFTAKSYPMRSVIQGLAIYGFPWCLFLPMALFKLAKSGFYKDKKYDALTFLILNFIVFFFLWLIPNQRSHHYAIPSLPLFLSIILVTCFSNTITIKDHAVKISKTLEKLANTMIAAFLSILFLILSLATLFFNDIHENINILLRIVVVLIILGITIFLQIRGKPKSKFISILFSLCTIWVFLAPAFFLPMLPQDAIQQIGNQDLVVTMKRPYFISERLSRDVIRIAPEQIPEHIKNSSMFYMIPMKIFRDGKLGGYTEILARWPIWKRRTNRNDFFKALKLGELGSLQTEMLLIRRENKN